MSGAVDANYIRPEVVLPFALVGLLNNLRTPGTTVICAKGHYGETKYRAVAEAAICIVGELALVWRFGIVGVLVGTVLASLYRTPDTIIYSNRRILGRSPLKSFARAARFAVLFAAAYLVAMKVPISADGYFEWALFASISAAASFASLIAVALIFDRKPLLGAVGYAKELLKGKSRQ
jgi:O-antigen/teichoic acid export membrane protein